MQFSRICKIEKLHVSQWLLLEPGSPVAEGVETRPSQTAAFTDVYVTKGAPTAELLSTSVGRLAFQPVTHPNAIKLADGFGFHIQLDRKPVANPDVLVELEGG